MSSRFDYVAYDKNALADQALAKDLVKQIETFIDGIGYSLNSEERKLGGIARAKSLAITRLEECYMWIGKAIRDDQIIRSASPYALPEERSSS